MAKAGAVLEFTRVEENVVSPDAVGPVLRMPPPMSAATATAEPESGSTLSMVKVLVPATLIPNVVVNEPEIGLRMTTPLEPAPVIVIKEPANKFPVSGALMATPIASAPLANRFEPLASVMLPVKG